MESEINNNILSGYNHNFIEEQSSTKISPNSDLILGAGDLCESCNMNTVDDMLCSVTNVNDFLPCDLDNVDPCPKDGFSGGGNTTYYYWMGLRAEFKGYKISSAQSYTIASSFYNQYTLLSMDFGMDGGFASGRTGSSGYIGFWFSGYTTYTHGAGQFTQTFKAIGPRHSETINHLKTYWRTGTTTTASRYNIANIGSTYNNNAYLAEKTFLICPSNYGPIIDYHAAYYLAYASSPFYSYYLCGKNGIILRTSGTTANSITVSLSREGSNTSSRTVAEGVVSVLAPGSSNNRLFTRKDIASMDARAFSTPPYYGENANKVVTHANTNFSSYPSDSDEKKCVLERSFLYTPYTIGQFTNDSSFNRQSSTFSGPSQQWVYCEYIPSENWSLNMDGTYTGFKRQYLTWAGTFPTAATRVTVTKPAQIDFDVDAAWGNGTFNSLKCSIYLIASTGSSHSDSSIFLKKLIASGSTTSKYEYTLYELDDEFILGMSETMGDSYKWGIVIEWELNTDSISTSGQYAALNFPSFLFSYKYLSNE